MKDKKILLQHPTWEGPREFDFEHARNILISEQKRSSGIEFVEGQDVSLSDLGVEDNPSIKETESDAIDGTANKGNSSGKANGKPKSPAKSKRARKKNSPS